MTRIFIISAATAFALGTQATAGALGDPVIDAPVIVEEATSSSSGTALVALLAILMMIPALSD